MLERHLSQVARDMESAEANVQKTDQSKSKNRSEKRAEAQEELKRARSRWDSESPNVFEKLQQVDEARIAFLRDALVRFETNLIDVYTSQTKASESAVASLLEINPTDEPMDFVTKRFATGATPQPASTLRPPPVLNRSASNGDSGSIRSSGGTGSSLKSKFGTLLKGKGSNSPSKRRSMMPNSFKSSNKNKETLPETREEPDSRYESSIRGVDTYNDNTSASRAEPQSTGAMISPPPAVSTPVAEIFETRPSEHAQSTGIPEHNNLPQSLDDAPVSTLQNSLRNVNIRSNSINTASRDEDDAAMDRVSSTLRAQPTVSRRSRGRRDVARNTVYGETGEESAQVVARDVLGSPVIRETQPSFPEPVTRESSFINAAPLPLSGTTSFFNRGSTIDRQNTASAFSYDGAESIRSSRSNTSAMNTFRHAEPTTDGFHFSVIETVSMSLRTDGTPADFSVVGEAAATNRHPVDDAPLQLQIQSPDAIDRLVANTYLLKPIGEHSYELGANELPHMTTLFKYQVRPDPSRQARFLPILLSQKWSPEETQTSVKLSYRLNPLFGASSLTLHDVEVIVSVNGSPNSCVAKPSGTFVKRSGRLVWRLNQLTLESGKEGSLLARFKADSMCSPSDIIELKFKSAASNITRGSGFGIQATRSRANPFADSPTIENVMVQNAYILQSGKFLVSTEI